MVVLPEAALCDVEAVRGKLDAMKALGIGLAAQGFGTGHVSGRHLRHLPIDLLKIDGPFIQILGHSTGQRLFVRTLIDTAHRLGMATVAEWVEDEPTAHLLASWGIDYLQGGLFGEDLAMDLTNDLPDARQPELRQGKKARG
jgi:EAL domain-containing protein (putative c-di-GMP-specific phosphodiesterase class I)